MKRFLNSSYSRVGANDFAPLASDLFTNLFATLDRPVSEENEYVMKGN